MYYDLDSGHIGPNAGKLHLINAVKSVWFMCPVRRLDDAATDACLSG